MSEGLIRTGFEPITTVPERIQAFIASGIPSELLSRTLGVSDRDIRRWLKGETSPKHQTEDAIDDIRAVFDTLLTKGLSADQAANLVQGSRTEPPYEKFIEFIVRDPDKALDQVSRLKEL